MKKTIILILTAILPSCAPILDDVNEHITESNVETCIINVVRNEKKTNTTLDSKDLLHTALHICTRVYANETLYQPFKYVRYPNKSKKIR